MNDYLNPKEIKKRAQRFVKEVFNFSPKNPLLLVRIAFLFVLIKNIFFTCQYIFDNNAGINYQSNMIVIFSSLFDILKYWILGAVIIRVFQTKKLESEN